MAINTSHVSLFVSRELREALEREAARNDRSLSAEVHTALPSHLLDPSGVGRATSSAPAAPASEGERTTQP